MADPSSSVQYFEIQDFEFINGDTRTVKVAYNQINSSASKAAIVPTCYGGRIKTTLTFNTGKASALSEHHVLVVAMLGNGESSSPSNMDDFPKSLDYRDQINAQYALARHLDIKELDVVVGFSMAGQQAYYWATMYPDFVRNSVCICGSARTSPHNYAFLEGPIGALLNSSDYDEGRYRAKGIQPKQGLAAFSRAYTAWLWSPEWFRQEIWKKTTSARTMKEFMDTRNSAQYEWDADDLIILARQWQNGDISKVTGNSFEDTLSSTIKCRMLVMPCETDQYFRHEDSQVEANHLKRGKLAVIPSIWGHAAGGGANEEDVVWMDKQIREFLADA